MRVYELLEKEEIRGLRKEIDLFAEKMLASYTQNLSDSVLDSESKEIFDPIWGPVEFNAGEIILLDSPLIQRLRRIKQLGMANYVYCDADYSRFAHTVGVFSLAGEMAEIINKRLSENSQTDNKKFVQIVRLAAIFHDSGHMYLSHVAEHYFMENENCHRFKDIKKAILTFSEIIDDKVSLHEMISVMLVNSPSVRMLLRKIGKALQDIDIKTEDDITEITEYISCLILGQANNAELLPFYQIINGPVDADKCDYLSRDSHTTNVPVAVDIFRLIHKLSVDKGKLPDGFPDTELWEDDRNKEVYYPTIKASAIEALNQLFMARSIMYNSVYYHHKVRTAETMLRNILEELDRLKVPMVRDFTEIMMATDDVFGNYCFDILKRTLGIDERQLKITTDKLKRIISRDLLKRACSVDIENTKIAKCEDTLEYKLERDIFILSDVNAIKQLEQGTKEEYKKMITLLNVSDTPDPSFMIMEFPKVILSDSIPNIIISYGNGYVKKYSEIFQTATWIESKESRNREHYLVTDCEHRELAFLAMQKTMFYQYGICLDGNAAICSKVKSDKIDNRRRRLLESGYYNDAMVLVSDLILSDYERDIEDVCKKYQTYEGQQGKIVTETSVTDFLKQFLQIELSKEDCRSLLEGVLRILQEGVYIDRKNFVRSIEKIFKELGADSDLLHICPLGGAADSGVHLTYYLNDINKAGKNFKVYTSLQEALAQSSKGEKIVLFDDGAYSGKQISSIFEEYMGTPDGNRSTNEHHVTPLHQQEIEKLRNRDINIAYICFNDGNEAVIREAADSFKIPVNDIKYMYSMADKIFESDKKIFRDEKQKKLVEKCLREIGLQILLSVKKEGEEYRKGWSKERVEEGALGYNDSQQFVILKSGVPTYTITAFWLENGLFDGRLWTPLFVRTDKDKT